MSGHFNATHGEAGFGKWTSEYWAWTSMIARCYNPNYGKYADYGGRGITVCDYWRNSYENFLADMGRKPGPSYSLDRYPDQDGEYCKANCRWATSVQQANNRRSNVRYTLNGSTYTQAEWCRLFDVDPRLFCTRIKRGWSVIDSLTGRK